MSLSGSLSSALSGLTAAARGAEVVASNIANARTAAYGRRELTLAARTLGSTGGGVSVVGVSRVVDRALLNDRRIADAGVGQGNARADFLARLETRLGLPGADGALGSRIGVLEQALIGAAARPESGPQLAAVLSAAQGLAVHLVQTSEAVQTDRAVADRGIAADVTLLNDTLTRVADMNGAIRTAMAQGRDVSALMDQRQQMVDQIAEVVPLREVDRGNGQIALMSTGGAILLDGRPAEFEFTPAGVIVPQMSIGLGTLSGLTMNGRPMATSGAGAMLAGGRLAGNFAVRDELAPAAQAQLDAVARDLIGRFADPAIDPTLAVGVPGLFTDAGGAFVPGTESGLATRLAINAAVDPGQGGATWRLRDGIGAAAPGDTGASGILTALAGVLSAPRSPASGSFIPGQRSFAALASDLVSGISTARLSEEQETGFAASKAEALRQMQLSDGVDTDQEMQMLLQIERAYGANAKVIQTVDAMLDSLMRI